MKSATILAQIDLGQIALPEFQRGYVWNREQVRGLFHSLYRAHPVGGLLVWVTEAKGAAHRGDGSLAPGIVKLLLDGQQRMTTLYGVMRGRPPQFFDGNAQSFTGLRFHLEEEIFEFYQPVKMQDDPLWVDVTQLMQKGPTGLGTFITRLSANPDYAGRVGEYVGRLSNLLGITDIDLHVDEITGADKTLDVVVDIFNRVNSGGTKLSKGDLALARIGAEWPEVREAMKAKLKEWERAGYDFTLDWLLRSLNTVLTGEARFSHLHDKGALDIQESLARATKQIDTCLNMIGGRLGLDHDRVLFGRFALPVMVRYLDRKQGSLGATERDKLLFWFVQAGMWGRFSGSTETAIDRDLAVLEGTNGGLDALLDELRLWNGSLRIEPGHFTGWSLGARFYPVLYMLTRMGKARDWGNGLPLRQGLLGKMSRLEVHHIFPKARLYRCGHRRPDVNALANYCLQTKETNLAISAKPPEEYLAEIEDRHPGALASQWIPRDRHLWKLENYFDFLAERRVLLAREANHWFEELLHGDTDLLGDPVAVRETDSVATTTVAVGAPLDSGIAAESEEVEIAAINEWLETQGLPRGLVGFELADESTGVQRAMIDLAWPEGLQVGLSSPWQKSRIRPGPGAAEPRRLHGMAMGKRPVARQASPLWVETADLPTSDGHPFFERLNRVLEDCGFDAFVEGLCSAFYAARMGRPSLRPGRYFRMLLIGYFEGLSSERGIAWRVADSLSLRSFLDLELTESAPDHSTLSRTRRLIDVETHEAVFTWVLERLSEAGLVVGKTVGIDATTLEANAAMRSIERRDTGESYEAFIRRLAEASGVETPTRAELARFDRSRKNKKTSNKEWKSPQDPDAKIAKMKDGRTHLAHKAEHGVDMDTGAIVSVTVQDASDGDTATLPETLIMAAEQVEAVQPEGAGVEEVVADKGYHSDETLVGLGEVGVRSHVSEPERGRRCWQDKKTGETPPEKRAAQKALYANRRRVRGRRGRRLQRRRGEVVERTFAHMYETGGMRRVWVRGHDNVRKRVLLQAAACNIGLLLRRQTGVGTPRSLQGRALSAIYGLIGRWRGCWERLRRVWGLKRSMLHLEAA